MKITYDTKKEIIRKHVEEKIPLSYLSRQYKINRGNLDYLYSYYLKRGDQTFIKKYTNYSTDEKIAAVQRLINGESPRKVAIELGLSGVSVLRKWKSNYLQNSCNIISMKKGRKKVCLNESVTESKNDEVEKLKTENLRLKAELDYIKKLNALRQKESQQHVKK